jgi:hypothetical protein
MRTALTGTQETVFESLFREWLVSPSATYHIGLAAKPSAGIPGSFFILDTESERLTQILKDMPGLLALLSPSAERVLYTSTDRGLALEVLDVENEQSTPLSLQGLPEKCVWGARSEDVVYCAIPDILPQGDLPDAWYQGRVSFTDSLWRIDTTAGIIDILFPSTEIPGESLDATGLAVNQDETRLIFTNKRDGSLWTANLSADSAFQGF